MDQEEVATLFSKYDLLSLPVVDAAGRLVGRITVDDVVDVIEEEASEDIYRLAGLGNEASVHESVRDSVRRRLPVADPEPRHLLSLGERRRRSSKARSSTSRSRPPS